MKKILLLHLYNSSQGKELLSSWFYVTETGTTKSHRANIDTLLFRQSDKRHQHHAERSAPSAPCLNLWRKDGSEMNVLFELEPAILWSAATTWIWASFYGWINFANIFYWLCPASLLDSFNETCHLIGGMMTLSRHPCLSIFHYSYPCLGLFSMFRS